jgi:hypothetical protein
MMELVRYGVLQSVARLREFQVRSKRRALFGLKYFFIQIKFWHIIEGVSK